MRNVFIFVFSVVALWAIDAYAFNGRYSQIVWQEINYQGHQFRNNVDRMLNNAVSGR